jgi:hypothetical protein
MKRLKLSLFKEKWRLSVSVFAFFFSLSTAFGGIVFDGSPGTNAPPAFLGGIPMFKFVNDSRPLFNSETTVSASNECPSAITFSTGLNHVRIGNGWATWSHGYTGDVYTLFPGTTVTITLPPNTRAFYLYIEPNDFGAHSISAQANDGTNSGPIPVVGNSGARYYGFYTTGNNCMLTTITMNVDPAALGFAIGEFGINTAVTQGAIACDNHIQISLDENCGATITPEMVLAGSNNIGCVGGYTVEARDWNTNALIDLDPVRHYPQIGAGQIGKKLKLIVTNPYTGNSCWGTAFVEDKLPPQMRCPRDITIACHESTDPINTGLALISEACGSYTSSYYDVVTKGSCDAGYDRIIIRCFVVADQSGNKDTCKQRITVSLGDLNSITYPLHYDGLPGIGHADALSCDQKANRNLNISSHLVPAPTCVDGYLLDSVVWKSSGLRTPRVLGWNCIDAGNYTGHPSPYPAYYPAHSTCWNDNQYIQWFGTGYPGNAGCSNIAATFRDVRVDIAKPGCDAGPVGCYKILRIWTLLNWCTGEIKDTNQIIKVMDNVPPKVLYPDSLVVNTDIWKCEGRWDVAPAWLVDNCSNELHYTVRVENGTVLGNDVSGYVVVNLPLGIQNAYIVAEDCCGNITERRVVLNVQDNTPPNSVCIQKTVVSITGGQNPGDNTAKVFATSFNNGSFDNCKPHLFFKAIRMDDLLGTNNGSTKDNKVSCNGTNGDDDNSIAGNQVYFDDHVKFCCSDAGKTIMVVFRVFDADPGSGPVRPGMMDQGGALFGRFSDCMIEVEVQDKSIPTVVAPPDIVISCNFWFDIDRLKSPSDATFGRVVTDLSLRAKVKTTDVVCSYYCDRNLITGYPGYVGGLPPQLQPAPNIACDYYRSLYNAAHPDRTYELTWGFDGYVLTSCSVTPEINVRDLRTCGQGRIVRDITAKGPNGLVVSATQTIWVVNCDPFYINRGNHCDTNDDIIWPDCAGLGTYINGCGADISPNNPLLGRPQIVNGARNHCNLLAIEHFDEIFNIEPDACYKILRKWVVIDWCQYDPNINPEIGRWQFTQVIKVRDQVKPVVTCNVGACEPAVLNTSTGVCSGHIRLTVTATDSCTPSDWLLTEYKIDLFNNGSFDYNVGKLTQREMAQGIKPSIRNNPAADNVNNPFDASGTYPIGVHKICFYVEDGCGNLSQCCSLFEIKDCKAPTPYCLPGIITVPMPSSGCVDIWAKDLNLNSFDNCTPAHKLKFYFNGDTSKRSIRVCCDDFIIQQKSDELTLTVQMYVEDEEGNKDYCVTTIIVQDNQNICPNPATITSGKVNGLIRTENGELTAKADVELYNNSLMMRQTVTGSEGSYLFGDLSLNNQFAVKSKRNDEPTNGISTADIVKIQRHILGLEVLNSPYKLIAADVNKSNSITASDISEIRKLILGVHTEFAKSNSWMIIPSDVVFANPAQPWDYPAEKSFITVKENNTVDFIAIKIGDVNNSASANLNGNLSSRNGSTLNLFIDEASIKTGEYYSMKIKASDFNDVNGFQFTLNFDKRNLAFAGFESGRIQVDESNFGLNRTEQGLITMSWNAKEGLSFTDNDVLFVINFQALNNSTAGKTFAITGDVTAAEAYSHNMQTTSDVKLNVRADAMYETGIFELYQNAPNPFDKETEISFRLNENANAKLSIYDVTGKVIYLTTIQARKGLNTVKIKRDELPGSGMYFYQLDSGYQTATKRMIILD